MKEVKQYVCLVDAHRRLSRCRNTRGRYRVGAKTEKEAKQILQDFIKFGSVQVYYEDKNPKPNLIVKYKEIKKEEFYSYVDKPIEEYLTDAKSATDKQ